MLHINCRQSGMWLYWSISTVFNACACAMKDLAKTNVVSFVAYSGDIGVHQQRTVQLFLSGLCQGITRLTEGRLGQ